MNDTRSSTDRRNEKQTRRKARRAGKTKGRDARRDAGSRHDMRRHHTRRFRQLILPFRGGVYSSGWGRREVSAFSTVE